MKGWLAKAAVVLLAGMVAGCGGGGEKVKGPPTTAPKKIRLTSQALAGGAAVPKRFTCDDKDVSPPLRWSGVPHDAKEIALLVEDPDAPGGTFVHWTIFGIDPGTRGLAEGQVPAGAKEGETSFGDEGYGGPCPPKGATHKYVFSVYALRERLDLPQGVSPKELRAAIGRTALASGTLTGRYGR
jgi:Raf kinase inhibitor-like YbhB/YbcL family protein